MLRLDNPVNLSRLSCLDREPRQGVLRNLGTSAKVADSRLPMGEEDRRVCQCAEERAGHKGNVKMAQLPKLESGEKNIRGKGWFS